MVGCAEQDSLRALAARPAAAAELEEIPQDSGRDGRRRAMSEALTILRETALCPKAWAEAPVR